MQDMNNKASNSEECDIVMSTVNSDLENTNIDMSMAVENKVN